MTQKELDRIPILEKITNKNISIIEGEKKMGISHKQAKRIVKLYKKDGVNGLIHKNRGNASNHKSKDYSIIKDIIKQDIFKGFSPTLLLEEIKNTYKINISCETLRQIMIRE